MLFFNKFIIKNSVTVCTYHLQGTPCDVMLILNIFNRIILQNLIFFFYYLDLVNNILKERK